MNGTVVSIFMTPSSGTVLSAVDEAVLEAGRGLVGDRYYLGSGTFSESLKGKPEAEITLIEYEEIEQFNQTERTNRSPGAFRRNIVTRGVRLNDLVGRRFRVGAAELEGICLCEPCGHLAKLVSPSVVKRMVHRAGLRARIVSGATIKPGDTVEVPDPGLTVVRGGRKRQALVGGPSPSPLALAVKVLWSVGAAILISLGAHAWWSHRTAAPQEGAHESARVGLATQPGCFEHASVRVTLTEQPPGCSVQRTPQEPGREMPCHEVAGYLRHDLNPPRGTIVGITVRGTLSRDSATALFDDLSAHGFAAGGSECFVSESGGDR